MAMHEAPLLDWHCLAELTQCLLGSCPEQSCGDWALGGQPPDMNMQLHKITHEEYKPGAVNVIWDLDIAHHSQHRPVAANVF